MMTRKIFGADIMLVSLLSLSAIMVAGCGKLQSAASPTETAQAAAPTSTYAPVRTASPFTGTPSPLRTPTDPHDTTCFFADNSVTKTVQDLAAAHGGPSACTIAGRSLALFVTGGTDPRPGFVVCSRPPAATAPYCGAGIGPALDRVTSHAANWQFYPAPGNGVMDIGGSVPGQYDCVGVGSQLWTFHLDSLTYTAGCNVPPDITNGGGTPCWEFQYALVDSTPALFKEHGKPAGCDVIAGSVVGVVDGSPQPGVVVCQPTVPSNSDELFASCGLQEGEPTPVTSSVWQFIPLPVTAGPVASATFDTAAGTACITADGQPFTFTLATRAFTPGCAAP
jgi:hypothetical protein